MVVKGAINKDNGVNVKKIHYMKIPYLTLSKNKQRHIKKDMKKIRTLLHLSYLQSRTYDLH